MTRQSSYFDTDRRTVLACGTWLQTLGSARVGFTWRVSEETPYSPCARCCCSTVRRLLAAVIVKDLVRDICPPTIADFRQYVSIGKQSRSVCMPCLHAMSDCAMSLLPCNQWLCYDCNACKRNACDVSAHVSAQVSAESDGASCT